MKTNLIKAEILWTRTCNLRCPYCLMYRTDNTKSIEKNWELWKKGFKNLKKLGCNFIAIYGAEPLMEMKYLPECIKFTKELNMYHTLITNCSVINTNRKLQKLIDYGLNSLTVSFDGEENELNDYNSTLKSNNALKTLKWFQKKCSNYRDVAVVFTLTKTNIDKILKWIPILSQEGIFVFFDLIHKDIGNPGTKCKNYKGINNLLFNDNEKDKLKLIDFGKELKKYKQIGKYKIHQSNTFINMLIEHPEMYINHTWNCAKDSSFPSWVTIDNNGLTRICDDFYIKGDKDWYFWNLTPKIFNGEFKKYWKNKALKYCNGCFWNTHIDANAIKKGDESFKEYLNDRI